MLMSLPGCTATNEYVWPHLSLQEGVQAWHHSTIDQCMHHVHCMKISGATLTKKFVTSLLTLSH